MINRIKYGLGPFTGGVLFSIGLGIGGMTEAKNIIGFLDIFGDWKPALMFVMGGAVIVYGVLFRIITKFKRPLFELKFSIPSQTQIDKPLVFGSLLFGVGWGITGLCPGPGIASLTSGNPQALVFVATMLIGILAGRRYKKTRTP